MPPRIFRRDSVGIALILSGPGADHAIDQLAHDIAETAEQLVDEVAGEVPDAAYTEVEVQRYQTDRTAAAVVLAGPLGRYLEGRHAVLTKAAAAHGHRVYQKGEPRQ